MSKGRSFPKFPNILHNCGRYPGRSLLSWKHPTGKGYYRCFPVSKPAPDTPPAATRPARNGRRFSSAKASSGRGKRLTWNITTSCAGPETVNSASSLPHGGSIQTKKQRQDVSKRHLAAVLSPSFSPAVIGDPAVAGPCQASSKPGLRRPPAGMAGSFCAGIPPGPHNGSRLYPSRHTGLSNTAGPSRQGQGYGCAPAHSAGSDLPCPCRFCTADRTDRPAAPG